MRVQLDPARRNEFFAAVKATPQAGFVMLTDMTLARFRETMAQNITVQITVYLTLAGIIAFGVIYNFARISLSEQGRELASLRLLSFTRGEVAAILYGEIAAVVIVAQPLGWLIGTGFALAVVQAFSSELYRVPLVIGPEVYAIADPRGAPGRLGLSAAGPWADQPAGHDRSAEDEGIKCYVA